MGRIARRVRQAGVYFVTTDTWQRRAIFSKAGPGQILLDQILNSRERGFYQLHAFVIMPNHLHLMLTPGENKTLEKAMQMIKGGSAHRIGKELQYQFPVWHTGFHDRWVRDAKEYRETLRYIEQNPVEARIVDSAKEYPWGSASGRFALDASRFDGVGVRG